MARFILDNDVPARAGFLLESLGHFATTSRAEGISVASDAHHLLYAFLHDLILVTHNERDFKELHIAWCLWAGYFSTTTPHNGILVVRQPPMLPTQNMVLGIHELVSSDIDLSSRLFRLSSPGWVDLT